MIRGLEKMGVTFYRQNRISEVSMMKPDGNGFSTQVDLPNEIKTVTSRSFILSTGRFFSRGLVADRNGISEPLLNIPVTQPEG
jgi:glycerol-3-phosphate dehydrogenase subunit B